MKHFAATLLTLLTWVCVTAQTLQYRFTHLGMEDGLAHNIVNHLTQDSKGFIWISTINGLQRYDGYRFLNFHYEANNVNSLPSDVVLRTLQDDDGKIWVGCNSGVAVIAPLVQYPKRVAIDLPAENVSMEITGLFRDSRKQLWLSTRQHGIYLYSETLNKFVPFFNSNPFNWNITSLVEEPGTGNYWLASDSGLVYYDVQLKAYYNHQHNPKGFAALQQPKLYRASVISLMIDPSQQLWINTFWSGYPNKNVYGSDFFRYDIRRQELTTYNPPANTVHHYASDSKGNTWLLGDNIFSQKEKNSNDFRRVAGVPGGAYGMEADRVTSMLEDKQHNRWLGTENGIYIFNPEDEKIFRGFAFDDKKQPVNVPVQHFLQLPNGNIWVATWGKGLFEYDNEFKPVRNYTFPSEGYNQIWSLYRANDGIIWIGCQAGLLMRYNEKTGIFEKLAPPAFDLRTIRTITGDQQGNVWFGTQHGLIVKYDAVKKDFTRYAEASYPTKKVWGNINKLLVDQHNYLWACTNYNGLLKLNPATGQVIEQYVYDSKNEQSLSGIGVESIIEYNDSLMIVSSIGINVLNLNTKKFSLITTRDGLPSNNILSLQKDAAGNIWAALHGALVKLRWPSKKIEIYGRQDGILNTSFEHNSMQTVKGGRIAAGTSKDFYYFNPQLFHSREVPPDVQITGFKIFDNTVNIDSSLAKNDAIHLSYDQNFITFEFSALNFLNNRLTYYYKLSNIDKDWVRASQNLSASYTHLPGGKYTFMVRCENGDGIQSFKTNSLAIAIAPPFWLRWWFFVLIALAFTYALYVFHRLRVNRLLAMEKVRDRIARDLHDDMGSTLSTINILSEMVKMKIDTDVNTTKDYITKIGDYSTRMMEAMDDIVWSINPMNDSMQKITARMREYATSTLEARDIEYTIEVDETVNQIKLDMEARRDFFLIFKEAVNNLAKYSRCTRATIKVEADEKSIIMKIQDDGIGFNINDADSGNGLTNMQKRAQSLKAKLSIDSKPGVGTKVLLIVSFA